MSMWGADSPTFPGRCGIYSPAIGAGQVGSGYHPVDVEGLHGIESPRTPYASSLTVAVRFHERPFGAEGTDGRSRGRWCGGTVLCGTKPNPELGVWGERVMAGAVVGSCCAVCWSTAEAGPAGLGVVCGTKPISGFSVSGESVTEESTPDW